MTMQFLYVAYICAFLPNSAIADTLI